MFVIQRVIKQVEEDLFLDEETGVKACRRVGSYYSVNGKSSQIGNVEDHRDKRKGLQYRIWEDLEYGKCP